MRNSFFLIIAIYFLFLGNKQKANNSSGHTSENPHACVRPTVWRIWVLQHWIRNSDPDHSCRSLSQSSAGGFSIHFYGILSTSSLVDLAGGGHRPAWGGSGGEERRHFDRAGGRSWAVSEGQSCTCEHFARWGARYTFDSRMLSGGGESMSCCDSKCGQMECICSSYRQGSWAQGGRSHSEKAEQTPVSGVCAPTGEEELVLWAPSFSSPQYRGEPH